MLLKISLVLYKYLTTINLQKIKRKKKIRKKMEQNQKNLVKIKKKQMVKIHLLKMMLILEVFLSRMYISLLKKMIFVNILKVTMKMLQMKLKESLF